jgi:hypothetical protein
MIGDSAGCPRRGLDMEPELAGIHAGEKVLTQAGEKQQRSHGASKGRPVPASIFRRTGWANAVNITSTVGRT